MLDLGGAFRLFSASIAKTARILKFLKEEDDEPQVTGKKVMTGNNVSHAMNKTRRRFLPNLQETGVYSQILNRWIRIRTTAAGLRTIEHKGGVDAWLQNTATTKLDPKMRPVKAAIEKAVAKASAQ
jgi:large subunit ribosomal protein L28